MNSWQVELGGSLSTWRLWGRAMHGCTSNMLGDEGDKTREVLRKTALPLGIEAKNSNWRIPPI